MTITTARSHKLMARVRRIESALSPLEKALLAQRTHLHFAYTAGTVKYSGFAISIMIPSSHS